YPLSHNQMGLWLLQQVNEDMVAYNVPDIEYLKGAIDPLAIELSFYQIIERHEILRTVFREVDHEPRQFVLSVDELPPFFEQVDLSKDPKKETTGEALIAAFVNTVFDFGKGPLIRVRLIKLTEEDYVLALNLHHIVSDGWSTTLLFNELLQRYHAITKDQQLELAPLPIQYKDYAYWQKAQVMNEASAAQTFWLNHLSGELPRLMLPEDKPRPAQKTYLGEGVGLQIENELIVPLERIAKEQNASFFMAVLALFNALFYRYTGLTDIIIGGPMAGREREELVDQLGYYVNTVVFRTQFTQEDHFVDLLNRVKENVLQVYEHQYYPFNHLIQQLDLPTDPSRAALFDYSFTFNNYEDVDQEASEQVEGIEGQSLDWSNNSSKYDISFGAVRNPEGLIVEANYNVDIYEKDSVERLLVHLKQLLKSVGERPDQRLSDLALLGEERQLILEGFNQTAIEKDLPHSIPAYFEQHALTHPDQVAVQLGEQNWTYGQINEKSNQLADWLLSNYTINKGDIIAFMITRSEWQIISMLAILKTGAAFLPLDPTYPAQRIHNILTDAQPIVTLTKTKLQWEDAEPFADLELLNLEAFRAFLGSYSKENPEVGLQADDLAYVIYTSGSTGKPKGVMVEHRGNLNMVSDQVRRFAIGREDRCLQFASISFDASVYEICIAFFAGCSIVLIPEGIIDNPVHFVTYLQEQSVTMVTLPPVYLSKLEREKLYFLRVMVTAGEAPNLADCHYYAQHLEYYNAFGPTEFSVCTSVYKVKGNEQVIPIGAPLDNTQYYILDEQLQPLPIGCWGEIYISGAGIARGYLNREEQTAATFIDHPFLEGQKMYKSGDIGKWLPSGEVVFAGRNDHMVKIRGYRVELAEIEQTLLQHPQIQQVVVTYHQPLAGRDDLIAYLVGTAATQTDVLIDLLKAHLPQYMIPGHYLFLDEIPLTPNGKTDFKALPLPTEDHERNLDSANTALEAELLGIWKKLLELDTIGVEEDFFEIGGHSLLAMMLISEVWEQYRFNLTIGDLVNHSSIRQLAALIEKAEQEKGLLLPLNKSYEGQTNLFLLPPIMGTPIVFYAIAQLLEDKDLNCYGLQYRGYDQKEAPDDSIAMMAASYFAEMEPMIKDQSAPINILGYSMGGMVGFELVHLLEEKGYQCRLIILDKEAFSADKRKFKKVIESDELAIVKSLWEEHCQTTGLDFTNEEAEHMKTFLLHYWKVHNQFILNKKIKASIMAIEATWSKGLTNIMKPWKKQTRGQFVHHKVSTDHKGILDEQHLAKLVEWIHAFVR
ncbi:MAG: amino acid adenylation domain-containing protein, partial [Bacteroidota bacterium]